MAVDSFKYCADCLAEGYHSIFMQLDPLLRCPIHESILIENCPNCGTRFPDCTLGWGRSDEFLACPVCHRPCGPSWRKDYSSNFADSCEKRWQDIKRWSRRIDHFKFGFSGTCYFNRPDYMSIYKVLCKLVPVPIDVERLFKPPPEGEIEFADFQLCSRTTPKGGPYGELSPVELLASPIYRAVRRKLLATIQERHSNCLKMLVQKMQIEGGT